MLRPFSCNKKITRFVIFLIICLQIFVFYVFRSVISHLHAQDSVASHLVKTILVDQDLKSASPHYKHLVTKFGPEFASKYTYDEKCELYFTELYTLNPSWQAAYINDLPHNAGVFLKEDYIKSKVQDLKREKKKKYKEDKKSGTLGDKVLKDYLEISDEEMDRVMAEYRETLGNTEKTEKQMIETMTHLRVFDQCYMKHDRHPVKFSQMTKNLHRKINSFRDYIHERVTSLTSKAKGGSNAEKQDKEEVQKEKRESKGYLEMCSDAELRLFPWLSKRLPVFTRWDGTVQINMPNMQKYNKDQGIPTSKNQNKNSTSFRSTFTSSSDTVSASFSSCFMKKFKHSVNGRGIVISASDHHIHDLTALLQILRALNNKLPIQFIHKGDLSEDVIQKLIHVGRDDIISGRSNAFLCELRQNYSSVLNQLKVESLFPPQEMWFVNVANCITEKYAPRFDSYSNKYLALLFNSFDEMLLMDTDAVPFINPNDFFSTKAYQNTETIFFKDRLNDAHLYHQDMYVFQKLLPTVIDQVLFDIPQSTARTLDQRFFRHQLKHLMESGIFAYRRSTHFSGMLASIQLNLWEPVSTKTWGDKETYWLGLSMMGDENYEFNAHGAGAIITNATAAVAYNAKKTKCKAEACSVQPAHISSEDNVTLLWINSGFKRCKKEAWGADILLIKYKNRFGDDNQEMLKRYYNSAINIAGVLVPPAQETIEGRNQRKGWKMATECFGYQYCARDLSYVGDDAAADKGVIVEFNDTKQMLYDYFGQIWINGYNLYGDGKYEEQLHKEDQSEEEGEEDF